MDLDQSVPHEESEDERDLHMVLLDGPESVEQPLDIGELQHLVSRLTFVHRFDAVELLQDRHERRSGTGRCVRPSAWTEDYAEFPYLKRCAVRASGHLDPVRALETFEKERLALGRDDVATPDHAAPVPGILGIGEPLREAIAD